LSTIFYAGPKILDNAEEIHYTKGKSEKDTVIGKDTVK